MQIRNRQNGTIMFENEFRKLYPNTSFPQVISEQTFNDFDADVVLEGPQASGGDHYQYSVYGGVEQIAGQWFTKYNLGPSFFETQDEQGHVTSAAENEAAYKAFKDAEQAKSVRTSRNEKLKESDWTQITDSTANKAAWATYRQALRDMSSQSGFPWTITWPDAP